MGKLVPVNLSERAYFRIKKMISELRFSPGSRLNVEQLARDLGTSHTPVWEAVRRLEQEGLVKNIPNRGVFLVELTRETAIDLYTVREVLEGMAARLSVRRPATGPVSPIIGEDTTSPVVRGRPLLSFLRNRSREIPPNQVNLLTILGMIG